MTFFFLSTYPPLPPRVARWDTSDFLKLWDKAKRGVIIVRCSEDEYERNVGSSSDSVCTKTHSHYTGNGKYDANTTTSFQRHRFKANITVWRSKLNSCSFFSSQPCKKFIVFCWTLAAERGNNVSIIFVQHLVAWHHIRVLLVYHKIGTSHPDKHYFQWS